MTKTECSENIERIFEKEFDRKKILWVFNEGRRTFSILSFGKIKYTLFEEETLLISFSDRWKDLSFKIFIPNWNWTPEVESQITDTIEQNLEFMINRDETYLKTYNEMEPRIRKLDAVCSIWGIDLREIIDEITDQIKYEKRIMLKD